MKHTNCVGHTATVECMHSGNHRLPLGPTMAPGYNTHVRLSLCWHASCALMSLCGPSIIIQADSLHRWLLCKHVDANASLTLSFPDQTPTCPAM